MDAKDALRILNANHDEVSGTALRHARAVAKQALEEKVAREQQPPPALPTLQEIEEHCRRMAGMPWNLPHLAVLDKAAADIIAALVGTTILDDRLREKLAAIVRMES